MEEEEGEKKWGQIVAQRKKKKNNCKLTFNKLLRQLYCWDSILIRIMYEKGEGAATPKTYK